MALEQRFAYDLLKRRCPGGKAAAYAIVELCNLNGFTAIEELDSVDLSSLKIPPEWNEGLRFFFERVAIAETAKGDKRRANDTVAVASQVAQQAVSIPVANKDSDAVIAILALTGKRQGEENTIVPVSGLAPARATMMVAKAVEGGMIADDWCKRARTEAVIGSRPRSLPSVASGLRCWVSFADAALNVKGKYLPPSIDALMAWSTLFRNKDTFQNYVGYLRFCCDLLGLPTSGTFDPILRRAKTAIVNRQGPPKARLFLRAELMQQLAACAVKEGAPDHAMLYRTAYAFLLRVRSEGLPIVSGAVGNADSPLLPGTHSCWSMVGKSLVLKLRRRKNKPHGSVLRRPCSCKFVLACNCPVHGIGPWLKTLEPGSTPFAHISGAYALAELRRRLTLLGIPDAEKYVLQDFRKGHADDIRARGGTLREILEAGEWRSPAFLRYLDVNKMEADLFMIDHLEESEADSDNEAVAA
jgi:hypothetical protein